MCEAPPDNVLLNDKRKSEKPKHKAIPETSYALTHVARQYNTLQKKKRRQYGHNKVMQDTLCLKKLQKGYGELSRKNNRSNGIFLLSSNQNKCEHYYMKDKRPIGMPPEAFEYKPTTKIIKKLQNGKVVMHFKYVHEC